MYLLFPALASSKRKLLNVPPALSEGCPEIFKINKDGRGGGHLVPLWLAGVGHHTDSTPKSSKLHEYKANA